MKSCVLLTACLMTLSTTLSPAKDATKLPSISELTALANQGDIPARLALGMRYRDGSGVKRDYAKALRRYRQCADADDPAGFDNVGYMYLKGLGVDMDFNIAAACFKAAAAGSDAQGMYNLGECHFSGQGVEQDYQQAIDIWKKAIEAGNQRAAWRLAMMEAPGEGMPIDKDAALALTQSLADDGDANAMILLGELCWRKGDRQAALRWWQEASDLDNQQATALLKLSEWRDSSTVPGQKAYVEVDHFYQGWNNCGSTSVAMFARKLGSDTTPYAVKRLCPNDPIGTVTDWQELVAAGHKLGQKWEMPVFPNDDAGFAQGTEVIRKHLDAGQPVVIDFTVTRHNEGKTEHFGHTLLVVGYNTELDQFVIKNPNQPSPGIELLSADKLKSDWHSAGYSHLAGGKTGRPLIVVSGL